MKVRESPFAQGGKMAFSNFVPSCLVLEEKQVNLGFSQQNLTQNQHDGHFLKTLEDKRILESDGKRNKNERKIIFLFPTY